MIHFKNLYPILKVMKRKIHFTLLPLRKQLMSSAKGGSLSPEELRLLCQWLTQPSPFVGWIVFLKIKHFSFHSFKCCSRSTDDPKNVLDASEIAAPGKQPLIEQIHSLTAKFPTLLSQILLATAQSLTLAVKVREAGSSLQLTNPGCLSCTGWNGHWRIETCHRTALHKWLVL